MSLNYKIIGDLKLDPSLKILYATYLNFKNKKMSGDWYNQYSQRDIRRAEEDYGGDPIIMDFFRDPPREADYGDEFMLKIIGELLNNYTIPGLTYDVKFGAISRAEGIPELYVSLTVVMFKSLDKLIVAE